MTQYAANNDELLVDVSQKRALGNLVFNRILTPKKVKMYSGKIGIYGADHLRLVNLISGGEQGYMRMDAQARTSSTYQIETKGLKDVITDEDYKNVQEPFDAQVDSTDALTDLLNISNEYSLASALSDTAIITQNVTLSGTSQWSDYDNSDPIGDVTTGITAGKNGCGMALSRAVCSWETYVVLRYHPALLDKLGFKENRPGGLTGEELAKAFDLKEVIIADSSYNTSKKGAVAVFAPIWGKHFVLFESALVASKRQTTLGYNVTLLDGDKQIETRPHDSILKADVVIGEDKRDQIITDTGCAYLIKDAVA